MHRHLMRYNEKHSIGYGMIRYDTLLTDLPAKPFVPDKTGSDEDPSAMTLVSGVSPPLLPLSRIGWSSVLCLIWKPLGSQDCGVQEAWLPAQTAVVSGTCFDPPRKLQDGAVGGTGGTG